MRCPICSQAELVQDTRDIAYTYKGETTTIPAVTGDYCPACGESIHDAGESARTMDLMLEFNKQVNASIVDPAFISRVRKQLSLDQRRLPKSLAAGSTRFRVMKTARPNRRWPW